MTTQEIRQAYLDFFAERDHEIVASSSLIPRDDPTLLFTNAGMNQFKAVLLGQERRSYVRAASAQKCMRVSGKHNDLEAVGRDGRHHTFFEMMGNWSFGDYYKPEAIQWGWEFLVDRMGLPVEPLYASVYKDDDESFRLWEAYLPKEKIKRLGDIEKGDEENFWSMGDTGPCGPCTEIHYDQGEHMACGPDCALGVCDCDRWLEIWNLVFIQFDRDAEGKMTPLPLQSVDTGLGLERLAALKAGTTTNYGSDLFTSIIDWVAKESGASLDDPENRVSMQVIADHARALAFAVADGGQPGKEGRGYVLRRILRRGARHGRRLGFREPFLYAAADRVIDLMGDHYRELRDARDHVLRVIRREEERFNETLDRGLARFEEFAREAELRHDGVMSGWQAFTLHDTYGFPLDLTEVMAEEREMRVDVAGFRVAMEEQRNRARASAKFDHDTAAGEWRWLAGGEPGADREASAFVGYDTLSTPCRLVGVRELAAENEYEVVLDHTPFYAESGGQVGDVGVIEGSSLMLRVLDTRPGGGGPVSRVALLEGDLQADDVAGAELEARVDRNARRATMRNHTATHLLHAALRRHVGDHAQQAGSLVNPDKLRFDFHHDGAVAQEVLDLMEVEINRQILEDHLVTKHADVPLDQARQMGAISMFGEKYGESVRVIQVEDLSLEFCGGTHCDRTGEIGLFRILGESAVGAGLRRIEAVTGMIAVQQAQREREVVRDLAERLSARPEEIRDRIVGLQGEIKTLTGKLSEARKVQAGGTVDELVAGAAEVDGMKIVAQRADVSDRDSLLQMGDALRAKLGSGVAVLGAVIDAKVAFLAVVTDDLIAQRGLKAGDVVKRVAAVAGGSGGGRPHLAQAGGKDPAKIPAALEGVPAIVQELAKPAG